MNVPSSEHLSRLSTTQRNAVTTPSSLLLCGYTGTGKTEVLVHRIAHLIADDDVPPCEATVVTRSRSAADAFYWRFRDRYPALDSPRVLTLRSWCVAQLRRYPNAAGVTAPFSVYEPDDVHRLLETLMEQHGIRESEIDLRRFMMELACAKSSGLKGTSTAHSVWSSDPERELFDAYSAVLRRSNALDWSDVDRAALAVARAKPGDEWRASLLFVDDAQELTDVQLTLLARLADRARVVTLAWAPDLTGTGQWGHPAGETPAWVSSLGEEARVNLTERVSSTPSIKAVARSLLRQREEGMPLDTSPPKGEDVRQHPVVIEAEHEEQEAESIVAILRDLTGNGAYAPSDCAIFARTEQAAESLRTMLETVDLPYQPFPERAQYGEPVPQLLAYVRLAVNPRDRPALERVINYPARGIGPKTQHRLRRFARAQGISLWTALQTADDVETLSSRQRRAASQFVELIQRLGDARKAQAPKAFLDDLLEETGLAADAAKGRTHAALKRWERVLGAISVMADYASAHGETGFSVLAHDDAVETPGVLARATGSGGAGGADHAETSESNDQSGVTLTTFPFAKDVSCRVGIITGLEEELVPLRGMLHREHLLNIERALLYLTATRSRERLYFTWARNRTAGRTEEPRQHSRFVTDLESAGAKRRRASEVIQERQTDEGAAHSTYHQLDRHYYRANLRGKQNSASPDPQPVDEEVNAITEGMQVRHRTFGTGIVVATEGDGAKRMAEVDFGDPVGTKKLRLRYAKLDVVGNAS